MASHAPAVAELLFSACSSQNTESQTTLLKGNAGGALGQSEGLHTTSQFGGNGSALKVKAAMHTIHAVPGTKHLAFTMQISTIFARHM